jgi:putative RecB family exonuclease
VSALVAPEYLSPSSMATFKQCPLRFKYSRIDRLPEPPTEASLMGNFVHDILENLYATDPDLRDQGTAKALARTLWNEKYCNLVSEVVPIEKHNAFRWNSWFCVENLFHVENPKEVELDGIEFELDVHLDGVRIKGFIDRFIISEDQTVVISDYKTGKVPAPKWEEDKFFQLAVYAAAVEEMQVGSVSKLDLIYLKKPVVLSRPMTAERLDKAVSTIKETKKGIDERCESGKFEPIKSILCDWCTFKSSCPAWRR